MSVVTYEISQGIATLTLNRPASLNALTIEDYTALSEALKEIDNRDDVVATVLQANGRWFSAGTDVTMAINGSEDEPSTQREYFMRRVAPFNTEVGYALSSHSKLLIAALNGPVMGITAAFLGHFDFIYCLPNAWLCVPFSFLGIIAEGGSSVNFVERMGVATAKEALIFGKKLDSQRLLQCGFVNKIFPEQSVESFHSAVRSHVLSELDGLVPGAVLGVKKLLKAASAERNNPEGANLRESMAQAGRFATGVPSERFAQIAKKEIKHKL
ncbi:ClpP/crotonase [Cristinia sonorae]|uniref:ClpP/crotonase n=1 Tax=Cristinia sonorae TaxID=1940300 RepID=A0A8K0UZ18_9AGAR|nr:ClpP/crotonase [Cristinia sonorae]